MNNDVEACNSVIFIYFTENKIIVWLVGQSDLAINCYDFLFFFINQNVYVVVILVHRWRWR